MYLIGKIAVSLLLAFALGLGTAWLAWFLNQRHREEEVTALWQRRFADLQRERDRDVTTLNREVDEARQQIPTLEKSLGERSDLIAQLEDDLAEWREKLPPLQSRLAESDSQIVALKAELAARDKQASQLKSRSAPAEAAGASAADKTRANSKEWDELRARVKRAEASQAAAEQLAAENERAAREVAEELDASLLAEKARAAEVLAEREATIEALRASLADSTNSTRPLRTGVAPEELYDVPPAGRTPDDLKKIRGVGPVIERTLNKLGIYFFEQIALLGPDQVDWVTHHLNTFPGRIERDEWISQAMDLADASHNGAASEPRAASPDDHDATGPDANA